MQRHLSILVKRIFPPVPTAITDDLTLLRVHQFKAHMPLLLITLVVIILAASYASVGQVSLFLSHVMPAIAVPVCLYRMAFWLSLRKKKIPLEQARRTLRHAGWSATGLIGFATTWSLLAWHHASPQIAIYFPIFIAMGTMATAYSLATMRGTGLAVLGVGIVPMALQLIVHGERNSLAIAITMIASGLFLSRMLILHHNHLVALLQMQQRMKTLAETDPLTNLGNRRALMDALRAEIRNSAAQTHRVSGRIRGPAVAMIDLDGFKPVNDCHGHAAGDIVLQQVALRFDAACRDGAKIYRLGGDEFALLIPSASDRSAQAIADGVMASLARPFLVDGDMIQIGASLGMAIWPGDGHDADSLIALADSRLYLAKADHHRDAAHLALRDQVTWAVA